MTQERVFKLSILNIERDINIIDTEIIFKTFTTNNRKIKL